MVRQANYLPKRMTRFTEQRRRAALQVVTVVLIIIVGCEPQAPETKPLLEGKELITVDFQKGQTLRYKFTSARDITIDWDPTKKSSKSRKDQTTKYTESMELVVAYTPIEVDPYGLTTIKATCESAKVRRSKGAQKDAVESLPGKTFTFTVGPTGRIEDYSRLEELMMETGEKAFRPNARRGRVKEPDMIGDFAASQWFLWDSVSSIEKPSEGISVGQSWNSQLSVPGPMVMKKARNVTYTLAEIRQSEKGRLAVIRSTYEKADSIPDRWPPLPYSGRFQMSGTFGFLGSYKIVELQGQGEELFNIDAGRIEQYNQQYKAVFSASIPMGIDASPQIIINQNLKMQILE